MLRNICVGAATLVMLVALVLAAPASAQSGWPAPPECKEAIQWLADGRPAFYIKYGEHREYFSYGGGTEVRYVWDYEVNVPHAYEGWLPAGTAEKVCGADFYPTDVG